MYVRLITPLGWYMRVNMSSINNKGCKIIITLAVLAESRRLVYQLILI